ncbi:MAG TPA: signal transduction protein, partial [Methylothermaceae bacterium]|nr:signal transduction protein [Methylothermaceae bacterium]
MSNFLIGRQPIYDRSRRLFGYELLYRDPHPQPTISGTRATEQLVVDALLEL